jgi:hypothetical protein
MLSLIKRIWTRKKSGAPEINHPTVNAFPARQRTLHHDRGHHLWGLLAYSSKKSNCKLARRRERGHQDAPYPALVIENGGAKHSLRFLPRKIEPAMVASI